MRRYILLILIYAINVELFSQVNVFNDSIIEQVRKYSEYYDPLYSNKKDSFFIPDIPVLNEQMKEVLIKAYKIDSIKTGKYISLIVLKVFRAQIELCEQTYRFFDGNNSYISYLFLKYSCLCDIDDPQEIMYCGLVSLFDGCSWIEKQKILMKYDKIQIEMIKIRALNKMIRKKNRFYLYPSRIGL
jgi:hypothetical protein